MTTRLGMLCQQSQLKTKSRERERTGLGKRDMPEEGEGPQGGRSILRSLAVDSQRCICICTMISVRLDCPCVQSLSQRGCLLGLSLCAVCTNRTCNRIPLDPRRQACCGTVGVIRPVEKDARPDREPRQSRSAGIAIFFFVAPLLPCLWPGFHAKNVTVDHDQLRGKPVMQVRC